MLSVKLCHVPFFFFAVLDARNAEVCALSAQEIPWPQTCCLSTLCCLSPPLWVSITGCPMLWATGEVLYRKVQPPSLGTTAFQQVLLICSWVPGASGLAMPVFAMFWWKVIESDLCSTELNWFKVLLAGFACNLQSDKMGLKQNCCFLLLHPASKNVAFSYIWNCQCSC